MTVSPFNIIWQNHSIRIEREAIDLDSFFESSQDILLVHGDSGCGKSGLVKYQLVQETRYPIWLFRATDFDCPSVAEFSHKFGNCTWEYGLSAFDGMSKKLCIIDSTEKVFALQHQNTFEDAVRLLRQHGWHILFTIRTSYVPNFLNTVLRTSDVAEHRVQVPPENELASFPEADNVLPADAALRDFLRNLFYLKLYLSITEVTDSRTIAEFMQNIWKQVICNVSSQRDSLHIRRERMICTLVHTTADTGTAYYVPTEQTDWNAITALEQSGIIQYDGTMGGYFLTHDVYEEIVLKHITTREYQQRENINAFLQQSAAA